MEGTIDSNQFILAKLQNLAERGMELFKLPPLQKGILDAKLSLYKDEEKIKLVNETLDEFEKAHKEGKLMEHVKETADALLGLTRQITQMICPERMEEVNNLTEQMMDLLYQYLRCFMKVIKKIDIPPTRNEEKKT